MPKKRHTVEQIIGKLQEQLAQAGVIETLFEAFDGYLERQG